MIVALTGFMGSGKSSSGKELAGILGYRFVDTDDYVAHKAGKSVPELLSDSEERFRALEAEAVRDVFIMSRIEGFDLVVALGGGSLMNPEIRNLVFSQSTCCYLKTSMEILRERLRSCTDRPLLQTENPDTLFEERRSAYEQAPLTVTTDNRTPFEVASEILRSLANAH